MKLTDEELMQAVRESGLDFFLNDSEYNISAEDYIDELHSFLLSCTELLKKKETNETN